MSTLIIGSEGSMGKRYQAILDHLGHSWMGLDEKDTNIWDVFPPEYYHEATSFIIATPTDTHAEIILDLLPYRKPILCEKPITKDADLLPHLRDAIERSKTPFQMMLQYKYLLPKLARGESHYDYFRHGNDGLHWDCLQIIGLAKGEVTLREKSPVWDCVINGHRIHPGQMDQAYVTAVEAFLHGHPQDLGEIVDMHHKVLEMIKNA